MTKLSAWDSSLLSLIPLQAPKTATLLIILALAYVLTLFKRFQRIAQSIDNWPGRSTLLGIELLINRFLPAIPGVLLSADYSWTEHYEIYDRIGWDVHSTLAFWPNAHPVLWLADADTIKEVTSSQSRFPKPTDLYKVLRVFGPNIIAAEAEDWKKFKKICSPAFSQRNNRHVWNTTFVVVAGLLEDQRTSNDRIVFENTNSLTLPIALSVLAIAGLGQPNSYMHNMSHTSVSGDHKLSFRTALEVVAHDLWIKIGLSPWMYIFHPRFRRLGRAFNELEVYLREMISERQNIGTANDKADLFNLLLEANSESEFSLNAPLSLTNEELLGNLFTFILGGHEGTAYTLCFALGALAIYHEAQDALFQEVDNVLDQKSSDEGPPPYESMSSLVYTLAVIYETLRMFPPVNVIPKYSAMDTSLSTQNKEGQKKLIPIPRNTRLLIHTTGLHFNPRYWKDPETFNPGRFLEPDWPRNAFIPFGAGSRSCLGRRFFETESVAALAYIVKNYKVSVKEEFPHESFEQRKQRIFKCRNILTLTPERIPLVFTRRSGRADFEKEVDLERI